MHFFTCSTSLITPLRLTLLLAVVAGAQGCKPKRDSDIKEANSPAGDPSTLSFLAKFNMAEKQFPTGITFDPSGKFAYVAYSPAGQVAKVKLDDGTVTPFGKLTAPTVAGNAPTINGIESDADGNIYLGVFSIDGAKTYAPGIYRLGPSGGDAELYAASDVNKPDVLRNPNKMIFDKDQNLYVTDSGGDGMDADSAGNVYTSSNQNRIVRYRSADDQGVVVSGGILDVPAAVKVWNNNGKKTLLITNAALPPLRPSKNIDGAMPGLVAFPLPN